MAWKAAERCESSVGRVASGRTARSAIVAGELTTWDATSARKGASILTADFLVLGQQVAAAEGAGVDFIHLDIMDGNFVPNISFGFIVIEAVRRATSLPLDVHLMIDEPERYIDDALDAGADMLTDR